MEVPVYFSTLNWFTDKIKFRTLAFQPEGKTPSLGGGIGLGYKTALGRNNHSPWGLDDYILMGSSDILDVTFTLYSEERTEALNEISIPSVPFKRNYRTTAYGNVLTTEGEFNLTIEPAYDGDETVSVD